MANCCCQFINTIFGINTILVGICLEIGGAYLYYNKPGFVSLIDFDTDVYYNPFCYAAMGLGAFIILSGIAGISGGCTRNKCLLAIYEFSSIILFLIFVALLIVVFAIVIPYYQDIKDNPTASNSKLSFLKDPDEMVTKITQSYYCQSNQAGDCQCYIKNQQIWKDRFKDPDFFAHFSVTADPTVSKVVKVSDCPNFRTVVPQDILALYD